MDAVYMEAVQAITGSGGWPMSVFLMPDRRPFFGGTYFPPDDLHGPPSFTTVLAALTDMWTNRRGEVEEQADELATAIASRSVIESRPGALAVGRGRRERGRPDLLTPATEEMAARFDPEWGGFGGAPKFPQPSLVDVALRQALRTRGRPRDGRADQPTSPPGRSMPWPRGGIHDHLGGGFARYSTDTAVAGPPLREDALRPGRPAPGLPARLAGDRRPGLPAAWWRGSSTTSAAT